MDLVSHLYAVWLQKQAFVIFQLQGLDIQLGSHGLNQGVQRVIGPSGVLEKMFSLSSNCWPSFVPCGYWAEILVSLVNVSCGFLTLGSHLYFSSFPRLCHDVSAILTTSASDSKIRRQMADCSCFLSFTSGNTFNGRRKGSWRDDLVVRSTGCSYRGSWSNSQHSHSCSQLSMSVTLFWPVRHSFTHGTRW